MLKHFVLTLLVAFAASDSKYCDSSLCVGSKHIACGNSGEFASSCPKDRRIVNLSSTEIKSFLDNHNKVRNRIASGAEVGFMPAARMASMVKTFKYFTT